VSVGSANFDTRSFRLNDEANLNVFSSELAMELTRDFNEDLEHSRRFVKRRWRQRPVIKRTLEWLASRLESQL
jgi:cardiolipin synthase